jgi:hypothetical protein
LVLSLSGQGKIKKLRLLKGEKMKFKKSMLLVVALGCAMPLAACAPSVTTSSSAAPAESSAAGNSSAEQTSSEEPIVCPAGQTAVDVDPTNIASKVTLNMSILYQDTATRMRYHTGKGALAGTVTSYVGADGVTYEDGDFKPVWKALQNNLNMTINDVTSSSDASVSDAFKTLRTNGFKTDGNLVNVAQGSSTDIQAEGTTNGTILDLSKYLDKMPNFNKFLSDNPVVKKTIVDACGGMYYAPYFDGFDDIERMLLVRQDWVEKLLDGDTLPTLDTGVNLTKAYTAFGPESVNSQVTVMNATEDGTATVTKKHTANIITTQNALTTMNGSTLVQALRDYIDATYNNVYGTKRSQLFCGYRSAYDIDELVALYRCVKTNGAFLTGDATKADSIVPLYPREYTNDRTADLWRLTQFFGVRGGESRKDFLYVGSDGKLVDARGTPEMKKALGKLGEMYTEGLILKDFTSKTTGSGKFENYLQKSNLGFSTYDYDQTQTVYNDPANSNHPKGVSDYLFTSILPAVADWKGDGKYFHYTESWRSVKTEGWFITADTAKEPAKLARALYLFDYLYGDEGNRLMSYGPDGYLAKDSSGNIKKMAYQGKMVPVLSDNCKNELKTLAAGNYTNYYRYWLGATYPVGYVKQQGMEYQTVQALAQPGLDDINNAISLGVLQHVNFKTNTDHFYDIVPTTLAFSEAEQAQLSANFADLSANISNDKSKSNVWSNIVMTGFGSYNNFDFSDASYLTTVNTTLNLKGYVAIQNSAFARM